MYVQVVARPASAIKMQCQDGREYLYVNSLSVPYV